MTDRHYALLRERELAALHRRLSAHLGRAQHDSEYILAEKIESALWLLGSVVEYAAHLTAES